MRPPGYWDGHRAAADDCRLRGPAQELQPTGLGALVLLAFLVCDSFSSRSPGFGDVQHALYVTAVALAALAAVLLLAPAVCLRPGPGRRPAGQVTRAVNGVALCGLAAAGLAVAAAVRLAARWAEPRLAADLTGAGTAAVFIIVWFALPWLLCHRRPPGPGGPPAADPPDGRAGAG